MAQRMSGDLLTGRTNVQKDELGATRTDGQGRVYRYVMARATLVAGDVVHVAATSITSPHFGWRVAKAASSLNGRLVCGVAQNAISASQYGYIQIAGPIKSRVKTNKSVIAGDTVMKSPATAGMSIKTTKSVVSHYGMILGVALGSDSGSFLVHGYLMDRFGDLS